MTDTHFKVGDKVKAFGWEGVVSHFSDDDYPIHVIFNTGGGDGVKETFTIEGKLFEWHLEPSLIFVERPNKMVKKKMWVKGLLCPPDSEKNCEQWAQIEVECETE